MLPEDLDKRSRDVLEEMEEADTTDQTLRLQALQPKVVMEIEEKVKILIDNFEEIVIETEKLDLEKNLRNALILQFVKIVETRGKGGQLLARLELMKEFREVKESSLKEYNNEIIKDSNLEDEIIKE